MRLWNVSKDRLAGMYDGHEYPIDPGQVREFPDAIVGAHVLMKLEKYGVVELPNKQLSEDEQKEIEVVGLRNRYSMLDDRVRNWRTMNKEREAAKLSPEPPSKLMVETVRELEHIQGRLAQINKADFDMVNSYLKNQASKDAEKEIKDREQNIIGDETSHKVVGKGLSPGKGTPVNVTASTTD